MQAVTFVAHSGADGMPVHISLLERFDHTVRREFRDQCLSAPPGTRFVVDFSAIDYIDSSGSGMLLILKDRCSGARFINLSPKVRTLLSVVNFDGLFEFE